MKIRILMLSMAIIFALKLPLYSQAQTEGAPQGTTVAQGPNITLEIKGMDIIDVLKIVASRAGFNIAIGKNVSGRTTLFLNDVDPEEAFDIVIVANDLAYERKGNLVNVMTQRDYELLYGTRYQDKRRVKIFTPKNTKAVDLIKAISQIKSNIGKVVYDEASNTIMVVDTPEQISEIENFLDHSDRIIQTRVFSLNYAQAEKINPKLQEMVTKGIGNIKIDERTNKIVITDYPENLDKISRVISAFDEKTSQVLIDAQIIELTPSDKLEMGVDWDYWISKYFEVKGSLPLNTSNTVVFGTRSDTPTQQGKYKAVMDVLRTIGDTKVLSSPRIMALNNQEAKILVGTKDAFITSTVTQTEGSAVTSQSVNFVDVGIKLYVTPNISRDGFITMKIKPEISSATRTKILSEGKETEIPIVTTSEAETTIMVKDGITIIIGGLKKDKKEKTTKRIPLLGSIPVLGFLFGSTSDSYSKTELVILLTPHIISGDTPYTDFSQIKPKNGAVVSMVNGEIKTETVSSVSAAE